MGQSKKSQRVKRRGPPIRETVQVITYRARTGTGDKKKKGTNPGRPNVCLRAAQKIEGPHREDSQADEDILLHLRRRTELPFDWSKREGRTGKKEVQCCKLGAKDWRGTATPRGNPNVKRRGLYPSSL